MKSLNDVMSGSSLSSLRVWMKSLGIAVVCFFVAACIVSKHDERSASIEAMSQKTDIFGQDGAPMVLIPDGTYLIGAPDEEREVFIKSFYLDRHEVTIGQFRRFVEETGYVTDAERRGFTFDKKGVYRYSWRDNGFSQSENMPVTCVSATDAEAYCEWAGKRLPTADEWEAAARGEAGFRYPWGNELKRASTYGNFGGKKSPTKVGSYPMGISPHGNYDMIGNMWEWVDTQEELGGYGEYYVITQIVDALAIKDKERAFDFIERVTRAGWDNYRYVLEDMGIDPNKVVYESGVELSPLKYVRGGSFYSTGKEITAFHKMGFPASFTLKRCISFRCAMDAG